MYTINQCPRAITPSIIAGFRNITPASLGHLIDEKAMDGGIKPLQSEVLLIGSAVTVRTAGRDSTVCHKVIDLIQPGDVIVVDREGDDTHACWGEMTSLAASMSQAAGVIIDGPVTDVQIIRKMSMPIYCRGASVLTTQLLGQGGAINVPIVCGGIIVRPGDLIFGDDNGILVIPPERAELYLRRAIGEEQADNECRQALLAGKKPSQLFQIDGLIQQANQEWRNQ